MSIVKGKGARLPSLGGKTTEHKGIDGDASIVMSIKVVKTFYPAANSYFNVVGEIWSQESGAYFGRVSGEIAFYLDQEAPTFRGGVYFNRTET